MMKLKGIAWLMLLGILLLPGPAVPAQPDRKSSAEEKKLAEASGKVEEQRKQEAAKREAWKGNKPKEEEVPVPAGEFFMGCNEQVDAECNDDEKPGRRVYVKAFKIDKTEVTVAQYRQCVEAGACNGDGLTMPFWAGADNEEHPEWAWACNWGKAERESHPINCLTWEQARAYCAWVGKRLPTEAEWEKAARGTDGRKYPWGNQGYGVVGQVANIADETAKRNQPNWAVATGYDDGYYGTAPVGSFPAGASPYGALDMAGNVWQWTADWYDDDHKFRAERGGSWFNQPSFTRASTRYGDAPTLRGISTGFRCVQ